MKTLAKYAAVAALIAGSVGATVGGIYVSDHYTFVDGSAIRDTTMEKINDFAAQWGQLGYAAGKTACNKTT